MSDPCNVLLVGHEPDNRLALETALQDLPCHLILCDSGEDALDALLQENVAVVLLDLQLPALSGLAVARMIRAHAVSKAIPILFFTPSDTGAAQIDEAYGVGAVDFLAKPVNPHLLRSKLRNLIELQLKNELLHTAAYERHAAQLRASQERMRLIMDNAKDWGFIELTIQGQVQSWGAGARHITGWREDEVLGKDIAFLFTPEDVLHNRAQVERDEALRSGRATDRRWHLRQDGTRFFADGCVVAVAGTDGTVESFVKIFQDTTARVMGELERDRLLQQLEMANARLRGVFEQAPAFMCVLRGPDHVFEMVNERYYRLIDKGPGIIGRTVREVLPEVEAQGFIALLDEVYRTGQPFVGNGLELKIRQANGSVVVSILDFAYVALKNSDGNITGVMAHGVDITDKKRIEAEARATDERYRRLIESIDEGFCLIEMLFDENGIAVDYRFLEINPEFSAQTGLPADAVGKTARELVPDLDPVWIQRYGHVASSGESIRFTDEASAMDRWFDVYATRLGDASSRNVALLFRDITKRRRAEDDLRRLAAELSQASSRKSEFLAVLAHELRNPLAPIRTGLDLMRLSEQATPNVARVRDMIERQVTHMVHLIDDLMDVARISTGKVELNVGRMRLQDVVATAIETSSPAIDGAGHRLTVKMPAHDLLIEGDQVRLAQVIANLLTNAAKYTPNGGEIALSIAQEGDEILIAVEDNGVGIPADSLPLVFDMFSQVSRNLGRAQGGLGIGLSLVKQLVELHGGRVTVASAGAGAGSCFTLYLPVGAGGAGGAPALVQAQPAVGERAEPARPLRIVVADDNVDAAGSLSCLLATRGHQVKVAHDGLAALHLAHEFFPDAMFIDIGMPGMTGHEVAIAIREQPRLSHALLVALTGWGSEDDLIRAKAAGFDHHLTKPAHFAAVDAVLQNVSSCTP